MPQQPHKTMMYGSLQDNSKVYMYDYDVQLTSDQQSQGSQLLASSQTHVRK